MQPFSIIVPAYNEEALLEQSALKLVNHSSKLSVPYEVVIVSNGSTDRTVAIGQSLEKRFPTVRFFHIEEKGVGRAFKKGMQETKNEHLVFMDADLSADLQFIEQANQLLDKNVMVLGTKINGLQNRSLFRKMGSFVFYLSVRALIGLKHIDYAPGAKAYQKSFALKHLRVIDDFTSFVLNLTYAAAKEKAPVAEIAINCDDRRASRFNLWQEALSKYQGLLKLKMKR